MAFFMCTIARISCGGPSQRMLFPVILKIDCTLKDLLALAGPQILDAKSEAARWKWSPLEKFNDLRPNSLADVGQYLPV